MNRLEIFQILQPIVKTVTGLSTVILADQTHSDGTGIPAPSGEYITIEPKQNQTQRAQAIQLRTDSATTRSIDVTIRAQITVEASINVFRGVDAIDRVSKLIECHKRPDVFATLHVAKLGWQRTSAPNNLTSLQSGNPEQRAQISVYLMYEDPSVITINNIESVSTTVLDAASTILYNNE
jgi:hypothetical protein